MELEIQVLDADYRIEGESAVVRVFGKDTEGRNVLVEDRGFEPYFYAVPSDTGKALEAIETGDFKDDGEELPVKKVDRETRMDGNQESEVLKVVTTVPPNVPKLKAEIEDLPSVRECREFDIPFYKRFLIDRGVYPVSWIRVTGEKVEREGFDVALEAEEFQDSGNGEGIEYETLAFDLEVYEGEVVMVSMYSDGFEKVVSTRDIDRGYVEKVDGEKQLIERFIDTVTRRDVDVLTGYNTDEFDFNVLRERAEHHGIELSLGRDGERMKFKRRGRFSSARLKGRMHLDLYPFIAHIVSPGLDSETLDLDSVAGEILDENKHEMSWEEMKASWREGENLEKFADYALRDAELAFRLGRQLVPQMLELSRITGLIPFDSCRLTYGQLTENFLLREAHKRGMVAPNRPTRSERDSRRRKGAYAGGFVYEPDAGLYGGVAVLDFRSLYPSLIVAHNISPDTLDVEGCDQDFTVEELGYSFCQDDQGFFPGLVEGLVEDRAGIKEQMRDSGPGSEEYRRLYSRSQALKILANSFYGYLGYSGARWYSRECAEATTYLGRQYIQEAIEDAEEEGFEVVYGDTDSLMLTGEGVKESIDSFLERVNSDLPEFMELEFEGYFTRGFFTSTDSGEGAKKKYALLDEDGNTKITGFEYVRRDWSPIAKETQESVLERVLEGEVDEAAELVKDTIRRLKEGEVPVEKLRIYTDLTKKPGNYDSTAPHVEAAKKAKQRGDDISPGETIDYVITGGPGSISDRAELAKYADDYDPEYYVDNQVIPVALRVLKVFGYTEPQLKGKGKQSGLERFG